MNKKINTVEAAMVVLGVATAEFFEAIVTIIPIAGEIVKWFINIIVWLPVQFWLKMKGAKTSNWLAASLIEFIPLINALPIKTITLILTIYLHNKPAVGKTIKIIQK